MVTMQLQIDLRLMLQLNLQDDDLLAEIHHLQEALGFGNPQF